MLQQNTMVKSAWTLGGRGFGEAIPVSAVLDIDDIISDSERTEPLELRIWVTGEDMAGNAFAEDFNDIDAPFHIWDLEQRVPDFTFVGEPTVKYGGDSVRVDSLVQISAAIVNNEMQTVASKSSLNW